MSATKFFLEFDPSDSSTSEDTDQDVESDLEKEDDSMSGSIRDRISQLQSGQQPPTQSVAQPKHSNNAPVPVPVHGRMSNHSLNSSGHEPEKRLSNQSSRSAIGSSPVQSNFNPVRSQSKTSLHSNDSEPPRNRSNKLITKVRIWDLPSKLQSYANKNRLYKSITIP